MFVMSPLRRRAMRCGAALVLAAVLGAPGAARAQETKVPRLGALMVVASPERFQKLLREGLRDAGYVEGRNIHVEYRSAESSQGERLAALAAELVALKVDVIFAYNTPAVRAAKLATTEIPIVMI